MNHSHAAIEARQGSTWNLDEFAESRGWEGVDIAFSQFRDSSTLEKSNWLVIVNDLAGKFGTYEYIEGKGEQRLGESLAIASLNHWAVGWIEYLCFDTARKDIRKAMDWWIDRLNTYPVANEEHWIKLEWNENHPADGKCYSEDDDCPCELEKA